MFGSLESLVSLCFLLYHHSTIRGSLRAPKIERVGPGLPVIQFVSYQHCFFFAEDLNSTIRFHYQVYAVCFT